MLCPQGCGSQAADEFHCPDCGWEAPLSEDGRTNDAFDSSGCIKDPSFMDEDLQTGGM